VLDRVSLKARFQQSPERLDIPFTLTNNRTEPIYLIDVAFRVGKAGVEVRPDHLMVAFEPPTTAILSSKLLPIDPSIQWATPPVVYATRIAPNESYQNTLGKPLPMRPEGDKPRVGEDGAPVGPAPRTVTCRRLVFELGVIPDAPELQATPEMLAGRPVYRLNAVAWKRQEIVSAVGENLSVPLLAFGSQTGPTHSEAASRGSR